ncbi:unnamed protein product [[Candida] boidinii]|nr:hypothetical protein B5S30_g4148 [[Candida] boidinii]OWB85959.1 hypothetical protein B5S33_g4635 [[Candida] boidinii]GME97803.1 unnamed protein product [[Candida] boidinii]
MTTNFNSLSDEVKKLSSNKSLNTTLDHSTDFLNLLKNYKSDLEKLKQNSNSNDNNKSNNKNNDVKSKPLVSLKKEFKNYQEESNKNIKSLNTSIKKYSTKIDRLFTFDIDDIYRDPIDIKGKKTDYSTEFEVPIRNSDNLGQNQQQLLPNINNRNSIEFLQNIENSSPASISNSKDDNDDDSDQNNGDDTDENSEIDKKNEHKEKLINRSIIMHLLRAGLFEIVKELEIEKNLKVPDDLISKFLELNKISNSLIKDRDLKLAIEWSKLNDHKLRAIGSDLEFNLLKLQFSKLLDESNINNSNANDMENTKNDSDNLNGNGNDNVKFKAYNYAKEHFPAFGNTHLSMISKVFSNLVLNILDENDENEYENMDDYDSNKKRQKKNINDIIINRKANNFEKFDDIIIQKRYNQLCQDYCSLIGLSSRSSLFTTLLTGYISLPSYIKFNQIFKNTKGKLDWTTKNELPFEIELPKSLQFHSIFICPVSKEETTSINPPMVLPCNHIISNESLNKLSNNMKSAFKCPYCPSTSVAGQSRRVKFITV